jgi:competence protein ComEC
MILRKYLSILLLVFFIFLSACSPHTSQSTTSQNQAEIGENTPIVTYSESSVPAKEEETEDNPQITPTQTETDKPETTSDETALPAQPQELIVYYLDVGQGDSILIDYGLTEVLIDGGDRSPGIAHSISSIVDGELEVVVATHPHADHIGGLIDVLSRYEVSEIWYGGESTTSKTYADFVSGVQAENAEVNVAKVGDVITIGDLSFKVMNAASPNKSTNNDSIVLLLTFGEIDFLFMGDAEEEAEASMLVSSVVPVIDIDILKVGHHGSSTASSPEFISIVKPEIVIYMAGEGNSYGHPHQETLETLNNVGAAIYGTDVHGTIMVTTDGSSYNIVLSKQAPPVTPGESAEIPPPDTSHEPTPPEVNVQIAYIFFDGAVPATEADEYVEIKNMGSDAVNIGGWTLIDAGEGYPSFTFPSYILQPDESVRVYTNEYHTEYGGFSFGSGKAVWNNSSPDIAVLYNDQGQEVSRKSY